MEQWKYICGFDGLYKVSNLGRIYSVKSDKILKQSFIRSRGRKTYLSICLSGHRFTCHKLVALAFVPNPNKLPEINHINGIKTDNRAVNLEWTTRSANCKHSWDNGLMQGARGMLGKNHKLSKKLAQYSRDGKLIKIWDAAMDVQREMGFRQGNITSCANGTLKSAYGFIWRHIK